MTADASLQQQSIVIGGSPGCSPTPGRWPWVSGSRARSSRELAERQLRVEAAEISANPDEEREELSLVYQASGLPEDEARRLAARYMTDEATAAGVMAREELGIDRGDLDGSPRMAAAASFRCPRSSPPVPVVPFLVATGAGAVWSSVIASGSPCSS